VVWWFKVACRVKYEITGKEHLSKSVPSIILCNHQSSWESFFLQTLIHPQCSVVKKELLKIPFFGWALNLLKPIAIDRRQKLGALKQLIQQGKERLSQGFSVLIFPEGTRVPVGASQPFSRGGAALATATQSPILAIAHNAGELWPAKSFLKYPGTIKLAISPIITTQGKKTIEVYKETTGWITQKIKQLASKN
jgi:1-acyl-sn-glycerol-3-phosphate acyltransferase